MREVQPWSLDNAALRFMWRWPLAPLALAVVVLLGDVTYNGDWPFPWLPVKLAYFLAALTIAGLIHLLGRWLRRGSWLAWFCTVCFTAIIAEQQILGAFRFALDYGFQGVFQGENDAVNSVYTMFGLWYISLTKALVAELFYLIRKDAIVALGCKWSF